MPNHSVRVIEQETSVSTPVAAESGVPFVVGTAPVHALSGDKPINTPILCTSWAEATEKVGYSDDWSKYTLCEFMYSHFRLFGCQPVIFCNVLDPSKTATKESVAAANMDVVNHQVKLPFEAIADDTLVVKPSAEGTALTIDTDYSVYYSDNNLIVELLEGQTSYSATSLNIAYSKVNPSGVTASDISLAFENVELCLTKLGIVPDLLCAPSYSTDATVAAVMATKANSINGLFRAKALIDIDSSASGATSYSAVATKKSAGNLTDENQILCWPKVKLGDKIFHLSTQLAGLIAQIDSEKECPYESPSNKGLNCDSIVTASGADVNLTLAQANQLNNIGVITALNFVNGWVAWGNYTACYPSNTDVKDYQISVSRMFDWVGNSLIRTFWAQLDKPMTRLLIDSIMDTANIWMNGLVGQGYLLGGRVEMIDEENPLTNIMAGIIKLHLYLTPPTPAQEIDFVLEYDANYATSALQG